MIYVVGGLGLAILYTAAALGVAIWQADLRWFGDITLACHVTLTPLDQCRLDAIAAGWQTLAGLLLAALILLASLWLTRARSPGRWALPPLSFERSPFLRAFLLGVALLLIAHLIARITGTLQVERLAQLAQEGRFASLENLCWPLLLQLYVADRSRTGRYLALTLLLVIASLTFFRAMLLAVLVFGVGIYFLEIVWRMARRRNRWRRYLPLLVERGLVGLLVAVLFIAAAKGDSDSRHTFVTAATADATAPAPKGGEAAATDEKALSIGQRQMLQRIAYPVYQASLAEKLAASNRLPDLLDGVQRKLHIGSAPNLNEYLYRAIYANHPVGQTTSLTYGEAAAWSSAPPLLWVTASALMLALIALAGRDLAIPVGLLVGLAIWRGFNGGVMDILPSLTLQLLAIGMMARIQLTKRSIR